MNKKTFTYSCIPERLRRLADQSAFAPPAYGAMNAYMKLLANTNTGLFFFPEYTDHGPEHILAVLRTADHLISEEAWPLVSSDDAVVLILSVLLHDAAMLLTADGLIDLVTSDRAPLISELDTQPWSQLFDEFLARARRWDSHQLFKLLGDKDLRKDPEPLSKTLVHVRDRMDPEQWSIRYRKFLGEFVRQHHARIAHEIARSGFPGNKRSPELELPIALEDIGDIAGLVARSHNLPPRSTYAYLDSRYDGHIVCRGTHPVFLMIVLRIADYLQLDSTRVSKSWQSIQRLRSPLSHAEWNTHLAVKEIRPDDSDPESLFISARPDTALVFVKLDKTISGLQAELDSSWAVLSELYGRNKDLKQLAITLRRVRSNLEDRHRFLAETKPPFFPIDAKFDTAGAELLKLLIFPLYGSRPDLGVRELLQNAIDAVHELRQFRINHPNKRFPESTGHANDVLIAITEREAGVYELSCSDKGIGMTPETVRDYFLKAGASFRQSDIWQDEFAPNTKSTVHRSGRFGIGVLSAFLIGERIRVQTRHISSAPEDAVEFEASIDDDLIELKRVTIAAPGTTITIQLRDGTASHLIGWAEKPNFAGTIFQDLPSWDWYVLDDPKIARQVDGRNISQHFRIPTQKRALRRKGWREICHPDFKASIGAMYRASSWRAMESQLCRNLRHLGTFPIPPGGRWRAKCPFKCLQF